MRACVELAHACARRLSTSPPSLLVACMWRARSQAIDRQSDRPIGAWATMVPLPPSPALPPALVCTNILTGHSSVVQHVYRFVAVCGGPDREEPPTLTHCSCNSVTKGHARTCCAGALHRYCLGTRGPPTARPRGPAANAQGAAHRARNNIGPNERTLAPRRLVGTARGTRQCVLLGTRGRVRGCCRIQLAGRKGHMQE